ncbi:ABC transporter [Nocardioides guangzhouensis]|uniref:ABC transporter n=1 Tax=Nocardioides guangzhouensis TaxID=2497878 RepID=A0A4V1Y049_9ACTN|nr:GTPase [Nocardioides guangzhouensis]RYP89009.1 ABC transporter [Nocardioides guangzhouensis]
MTTLLEGAKKLVSRSSDVGALVAGLETAVTNARGRLDDELVDAAQEVVDRASGRLLLTADHTIIAIAGATGSGKSSTFNALTGLELSAVGVRRPTTSWATACVWGTEGAPELLEWLGIPARHQVTRDSMLDVGREDRRLDGTVLLDLPDHDSTEVSHHLEVDRLVKLADLLVWVLDPQKYADAAIHDRYLKKLSGYGDVTMVVLNHIDTVPEDRREAMLADVRRLLDQDGLADVPVLAISARHGIGLDRLKDEMVERATSKKAMRTRLQADVRAAAGAMATASGTGRPGTPARDRTAELEESFADAAGVPIVVDAVAASTRLRARRATGWPVTSWLSRLRPDPLRRLHLDLGSEGRALTKAARTSVPEPTRVQRARVDAAVRGLADDVAKDLHRPWQDAVRRASVQHLDDIGDRLDSTLAGTDLGVARIPVWAGVVRVLQWLLITSAVAGAGWLAVLAVMSYLKLPEPETPSVIGVPVPTLMLLGGVLLGVLLGVLCWVLVAFTARARAHAADRRLRTGIRSVIADLVTKPIDAELEAYNKVRHGLNDALS